MAESLNPRSPVIYTPKSISDLVNTVGRVKEAVIWAGGTSIMSHEGFYPSLKNPDIISLKDIPDFFRISGNEHLIEIGAMVTIEKLLGTGLIPRHNPLYNALGEVGNFITRAQATIAGALANPSSRYALCAILGSVNAQVELKLITKIPRSKLRNVRTSTHWIPVSKLYKNDGSFIYAKNGIITRIRIPAASVKSLVSVTTGSPMKAPSETVHFALNYTVDQGMVIMPKLCIALPQGGYFDSLEVNGHLGTLNVPMSQSAMKQAVKKLSEELTEHCANITEIQHERAKRLLLTSLYHLNAEYLSAAAKEEQKDRV